MANKKTYSKRQKDMKSKLMAAVCMLLVSSIMLVSSTYAWFTLSTAPEVTGITTQVGANGNLEMALLPTDAKGLADYGITSEAGDSAKDATERNLTWGNLVDLSDSSFYGLDKISLYPAKLNDDGNGNIKNTLLATPSYGADGRVGTLLENTVTGVFDGVGKFPQADNVYGVRAVGNASGMTTRQLAYRNARSAANSAVAQAKTTASQSLTNNGAALASIAMVHGMDAAATHTQADVASLQMIVADLLGIKYEATSEGATHYQEATVVTQKAEDGETDVQVTYYSYHPATAEKPATHKVTYTENGVLDLIESAYKSYLVGYAASGASGLTDEEFTAAQATINSAANVYEALAEVGSAADTLSGPLSKLQASRTKVQEAYDALNTMTASAIEWGDLSTTLYKLADTNNMKINGIKTSEVKENIGKLMGDVTGGKGVTATIASGGGIYADIADHCGDFSAGVVIRGAQYQGITVDLKATMTTDSDQDPNYYLTVVGGAVERAGAPENDTSAGGEVMPISDMYGYVIDLGFRTNAAESNLLLQTEAADRIYSDNAVDAETRGHGSTMSFTRTSADFTLAQMKGLMGAVRVVFFDAMDNNKILATAKLDMTENSLEIVGGQTITAKLYLVNAEGNMLTTQSEAVITALNQNTAKAVSALVYLDGENIRNADVAATATTSMTGTMNLQFASSANLQPMDYTALQSQGGTAATTAPTTATTESSEPQG